MTDTYTINAEVVGILPMDKDEWIIIINDDARREQIGFIVKRPILKSFEVFQEKYEHFSCRAGLKAKDNSIAVSASEITTVLTCNEGDTIRGENLIEQYANGKITIQKFTNAQDFSVTELLDLIIQKQEDNVT